MEKAPYLLPKQEIKLKTPANSPTIKVCLFDCWESKLSLTGEMNYYFQVYFIYPDKIFKESFLTGENSLKEIKARVKSIFDYRTYLQYLNEKPEIKILRIIEENF